jgi:ubiquitin carboxyl-terminal hydrolase 4/11/15
VGPTRLENHKYNLFAVTNHRGNLQRGHYTAFVKAVEGKDGTSTWYYCDDESVEEAQSSNIVTSAAYILFYSREKMSNSNMMRYAV